VRAGLLKAGIGYWRITPFERRVLAAVAAAHAETGAPVMIHLEHGSAGFEVLEALAADGVPASAVVLAHADRAPDPVLHADLAAAGAYLGYDGWARYREWPDSMLVACAARAIELGAGERILLGGDVARRTRYVAYGGMPGLSYLGRRAVPALRAEIGDAGVRTVLVDNPARLLGRF
jgi:phosphotriesterase-related protein